MHALTSLSDETLLENTLACARNEREKTAILVAHLAEVYRRDLALKRGYPSLFKYAREALKLSDKMAWERTTAAQLSLQIPGLIEKIASGELSLDAACGLSQTIQSVSAAPEATPLKQEDKRELLEQVLGKTRKQSEPLFQAWAAEKKGEPLPPAKPQTYTVTLELNEAELAEWNRLKDLISHKTGSRDSKAAFDWLLRTGLDKVDPARIQARAEKRNTKKPDAPSRPQEETPHHARRALPAALKRRVFLRDQARCQYTDPETGRQCGSTAFLDFDHITPKAHGGSDDESNLRLACASHNRRRYFWDVRT